MVDIFSIVLILILLISIYIAYIMGHRIGSFRRDKFWESEMPLHRKDAIERSRAVLGGQFSEQLAPFLPKFNYSPTECKFIGKPVDFIVFKGADNKEIKEVVFVEVKKGKSKLSQQENNLKNTIENKRVRWEEYRVPENKDDLI